MKRAAESYPPQCFTKPDVSRSAALPAPALPSISAQIILALALVASASAPAFAQRGGASQATTASSHTTVENSASGSHLSEGSRIGSAEGHVASAAKSPAQFGSSKSALGERPLASAGVQLESRLAASTSFESTARLHLESPETESAEKKTSAALPPPATVYPREVVIGFPPTPAESGISSKTLHDGGAVVSGQRNEFWAEEPQRGGAAPHAGAPVRSAPITTSRPFVAPRAPMRGVRFAPLRPTTTMRRSTFAFLRGPSATSPPHVFGPRRGRPRFFDGFGFFPFAFGFPFFDLGFASDCNPFWAWPWAFGCETFGYWNGYNQGFIAGYNAGPEEQPQMEGPPEEQPPEEPETFTYIPPPEPSSPEEIEAEKVLVVLYMKNGAVYAVTNYWVADAKLHYLTSYGGENTIDLNDLDLQKTVDVNAKRGVEFTLKPAPEQKHPNPQPPQDQPNPPEPQD